jgi:hypothetical protein
MKDYEVLPIARQLIEQMCSCVMKQTGHCYAAIEDLLVSLYQHGKLVVSQFLSTEDIVTGAGKPPCDTQ